MSTDRGPASLLGEDRAPIVGKTVAGRHNGLVLGAASGSSD